MILKYNLYVFLLLLYQILYNNNHNFSINLNCGLEVMINIKLLSINNLIHSIFDERLLVHLNDK